MNARKFFNLVVVLSLILCLSLIVYVNTGRQKAIQSQDKVVKLARTGQMVPFAVRVYRLDYLQIRLPESQYFDPWLRDMSLPQELGDFSDPAWWNRLHDWFQYESDHAGGFNRFGLSINAVPSAKWLANHVLVTRRSENRCALTVYAGVGELYSLTDQGHYSYYLHGMEVKEGWFTAIHPLHLKLDGQDYYSVEELSIGSGMSIGEMGGSTHFDETMETFREAWIQPLLFRVEGGKHYVLIEQPEEIWLADPQIDGESTTVEFAAEVLAVE